MANQIYGVLTNKGREVFIRKLANMLQPSYPHKDYVLSYVLLGIGGYDNNIEQVLPPDPNLTFLRNKQIYYKKTLGRGTTKKIEIDSSSGLPYLYIEFLLDVNEPQGKNVFQPIYFSELGLFDQYGLMWFYFTFNPLYKTKEIAYTFKLYINFKDYQALCQVL